MLQSEDPSTLALDQAVSQPQTSCQPKFNSIFVFIILGFIFLIVGIAKLITNYQQNYQHIELQLKGQKLTNTPIFVSFVQDSQTYIYLNLPWLTQLNYTNRYEGYNIEEFTLHADSCLHFKYNKQVQKEKSVDNSILNADSYAVPCGRFPSLFQGTNLSVSINSVSKFVDSSDLTNFNYAVNNFNLSLQWFDLTDSEFQSWMQQNAVIQTTKLIGVMKGSFQGQIQMQLSSLDGKKAMAGSTWIYITNNKALGGYDVPFCFINLCQSAIVFLFALAIYLFKKISLGQGKDQKANKFNQIQELTNQQSYSGKSDNL